MPREKSRYRDRRSSSYSSESSYERKKSKSKHKRRSRSRDRSDYSESSSLRRKRSSSRGRNKRRSHSRSVSRDRYGSKLKRSSSSRSRSKRDRSRSPSRPHSKRDRSRSVSSSRSRSKYKSKKSKRSRSSSSRSSSYETERNSTRKYLNTDNKSEIEKAIKAAEAAGLTLQKIPTYEYKEVPIKEDMPTIHDRNLLADLNSESFVQKPFTSSKGKKQNIVIDLNTQTVTVPEAEARVPKDDSIINFDELPSEEELREMWIKKVYQYRKKIVKGEP